MYMIDDLMTVHDFMFVCIFSIVYLYCTLLKFHVDKYITLNFADFGIWCSCQWLSILQDCCRLVKYFLHKQYGKAVSCFSVTVEISGPDWKVW